MGRNEVSEEMMFYGTLTAEEKSRMHPCKREKCVMRQGDSPPPMQTSIPSGYDLPDDASMTGRMSSTPPAITTSMKPLRSESESDAEVIEEAVPIVHKTLPVPEPEPKIESNGIDHKHTDEKSLVHDPDDDPCLIKCIYFTQQCCECTIM